MKMWFSFLTSFVINFRYSFSQDLINPKFSVDLVRNINSEEFIFLALL